MQESQEDRSFAELMKKSMIKMPFSDFEDTMMRKIEAEVQSQKSILNSINISLLFFILGTGLGIAISLFLPKVLSGLSGIPTDRMQLIFQACFILVVLTQLDKLYKLVKKYSSI